MLRMILQRVMSSILLLPGMTVADLESYRAAFVGRSSTAVAPADISVHSTAFIKKATGSSTKPSRSPPMGLLIKSKYFCNYSKTPKEFSIPSDRLPPSLGCFGDIVRIMGP
jgi:hypothetical protein